MKTKRTPKKAWISKYILDQTKMLMVPLLIRTCHSIIGGSLELKFQTVFTNEDINDSIDND